MLTLETVLGCAVPLEGCLIPHLDAPSAPARRGQIYDAYIGEASCKRMVYTAWSRRVRDVVLALRPMFEWGHLRVGGGIKSGLGSPRLPPSSPSSGRNWRFVRSGDGGRLGTWLSRLDVTIWGASCQSIFPLVYATLKTRLDLSWGHEPIPRRPGFQTDQCRMFLETATTADLVEVVSAEFCERLVQIVIVA